MVWKKGERKKKNKLNRKNKIFIPFKKTEGIKY